MLEGVTRYQVKKLENKGPFVVEVPGSKSISNRALMLAALGNKKCVLKGVLFSDDSRAFLSCLESLGFELEIDEPSKIVTIWGTDGNIPNKNATIDVRSAGTAARFLTVMLALAGGDYELKSSLQMEKRPMEPLIGILKEAGVEFEFGKEEGHFPFKMHSHNIKLDRIQIDTTVSSQFTSALLMSAVLLKDGLVLEVTGSRTAGSYIKMTLAMMKQFNIPVNTEGNIFTVPAIDTFGIEEYLVEPDLSAAAYFYSIALMFGTSVCVKNVHRPSLQGDIKYVELLEKMGGKLEDSLQGLWYKADDVKEYNGITVDMKDFSDQTMTMAVVAAFAKSPTKIVNVGHIRFQESDRLSAIITELNKLGIKCEELKEEEGILITPTKPNNAVVETYEDHRIAMAFALFGLKVDGVVIDNPNCCRKTFENYFETLETLY